MTSTESTSPTKPCQFSLESIFLATAAVAVALALLRWLGPDTFFIVVILPVQCVAVIAVLMNSDGTAWLGVIIGGIAGALLAMLVSNGDAPSTFVFFFASCAAWFGGGLAASAETKRQSCFLRWASLLALAWFLVVVVTSVSIFDA